MHLPGKVTYKEIDEMISTVDKNKDGKISYSEFRVSSVTLSAGRVALLGEVMLGALPLVIPDLTKVPELMDRCLLSDRSLSLTISDMLQ